MADEAGGTVYPVDVLRAFTLRAFKTAGVPAKIRRTPVTAPGRRGCRRRAG